jgi:pimeloyl-ACP methyl ester carboxylesterase
MNGKGYGIAGLALAAVGSMVAGGVAVERRAIGRARNRPDPFVDEPLGKLHTPAIIVTADDGVPLHVEVDGDVDAPLTVVFCHGYTLSSDCFHFQRRELADVGRLVFYDARSHGRSGRSSREHSTIDQLGADLWSVIEAAAPDGPVVLVGHSMGGMTILALADQRPELFGERVVGVALLSTSAGKLADSLLGMPVWLGKRVQPVVPSVVNAANHRAAFIEKNRRAGSDLLFLATRYLSFGPDVAPSLVAFMEQMISATPIEVITEFFDTFMSHDKLEALPVLADIPVLVSVGSRDALTPPSHSTTIADALPDAESQVIPGAGHMAIIDRYAEVNDALRRLVDQAREAPDALRAG